ncbi:hypothetical protein ACJ41O_015387 [Fusarium nematophilum]
MHPFSLWAVLGCALAATASKHEYDYVVVGGGPSGIITAERLAEANKNVLLLERGQGPTVSTGANTTLSWNNSLTPIDVPGLTSAIGGLDLWNEYMCDDTPDFAACVLGGGATINFMVFVHPAEHDFEKWPRGWRWSDIAPAATRLYNRNSGTTSPSADGKRYNTGVYTALSDFLGGLGWKSVDMVAQPNEKHEVYSYPSWNIKNAMRAGPVRTYLPLVEKQNNFRLRLGAKVIRLVRSKSRVTGLEVETDGKREIIKLSSHGRVVLAAGALSTPKILFHSGIGPKSQVRTAKQNGVAVPSEKNWIDLPVGKALKDHAIFSITLQTDGTPGPLDTASVLNGTDLININLYEGQDSGVLTEGRHGLIFFTSRVGEDGVTRYFQGSCAASAEGTVSVKTYLTHGLTSSGVLGLEKGGNLVFEKSPHLQTSADKKAAASFIQEMVDAVNAPSSGLKLLQYTNTSAILDSVSRANHYTGTARMGTDDGRRGGKAVVDTNAKVYGVDNLFISDASIHPDLPTGNSQAIVMVIAEAAVAKILAFKGQ